METAEGLPVLNPRDLVQDFVNKIRQVYPEARFVVAVADPRDVRGMSIEICLDEAIKGPFLRDLTLGMWQRDKDEDGYEYVPNVIERDTVEESEQDGTATAATD